VYLATARIVTALNSGMTKISDFYFYYHHNRMNQNFKIETS
jgi:hypothetical protein